MPLCPCGTMLPDVICCKPLVNGTRSASTALALMRSRYSAFVWKDANYLNSTQQNSRPVSPVSLSAVTWTGIHILSIENGRPTDSVGTVEFKAHYTENGRKDVLQEKSDFKRIDGKWIYVGARTP